MVTLQYQVVASDAQSDDVGYSGLGIVGLTAVNNDDDTAGVTVNLTTSAETSEDGASAEFTVVLDSEPISDILINVISSDSTEGAVSLTSLTFTPDNWDAAQTVTVTGVDDPMEDGDVVYDVTLQRATGGDSKYRSLNPSVVTLTNLDNNDQLTGDGVVVASGRLTSANPTEAFSFTGFAGQRLFYDAIDTNYESLSLSLIGPGGGVVWQSIADEDFGPFTLTEGGLYSLEIRASADDAYGDFAFRLLDVASLSPIQIPDILAGINDTQLEAALWTLELEAGSRLQFVDLGSAGGNAIWTIRSPGDEIVEQVPVGASFELLPQASGRYLLHAQGINEGEIGYVVEIKDITVGSIVPNASSIDVDEDGTGTFWVSLGSAPDSPVIVTASKVPGGDPNLTIVDGDSLTFTTENWNQPQPVTIAAAADEDAASGQALFSLEAGGWVAAQVTAFEQDDEVASVIITESNAATEVSEDGVTDTYFVALSSKPLSDVLVIPDPDQQLNVDPQTLLFTADNWMTPQPISVMAVDDALVNGTRMKTCHFAHHAMAQDGCVSATWRWRIST